MTLRSEFIFDEPVEYKGLKIYPATMKDYLLFHALAECLIIDKNSIADAAVISMTYMEYLWKKSTSEQPFIAMFDRLLKMVLKKDDIKIQYGFDKEGKSIFIIDNVVFYSADFDEIKKIICEQNLVEIPDETISKEVREKIKEADAFRRKLSGTKMGTIEDQVICVMISTSLTLPDIEKMSIRKFVKILQRIDHKLHYQIYLSASMNGFVEFKDKSFIKHWMADLTPASKFEGSTMGVEDLHSKIHADDLKKSKGSSISHRTKYNKSTPRKKSRR